MVVGQGSPLVENNLEELHRCPLEEVEEKGEPFSRAGSLDPLETMGLWLEEMVEEQSHGQPLHMHQGEKNQAQLSSVTHWQSASVKWLSSQLLSQGRQTQKKGAYAKADHDILEGGRPGQVSILAYEPLAHYL